MLQAQSIRDQFLEAILHSLSKADYKAFAKQTITVDGTVKSLTVPDGAKYALFTVESTATGVVTKHWMTGDNPTATDGLASISGGSFEIHGNANLKNFKITQAQAGTHRLNVVYFY